MANAVGNPDCALAIALFVGSGIVLFNTFLFFRYGLLSPL